MQLLVAKYKNCECIKEHSIRESHRVPPAIVSEPLRALTSDETMRRMCDRFLRSSSFRHRNRRWNHLRHRLQISLLQFARQNEAQARGGKLTSTADRGSYTNN